FKGGIVMARRISKSAAWGKRYYSRKCFHRTERLLARAIIESMEARFLLSYTVSTSTDGPATTTGTLRWAIAQATTNAGAQSVDFASSIEVIQLNGSPIQLSKTNGTISIQSTAPVTLDAHNASSLFTVSAATTAVIDGLTLQRGTSTAGGA